MVQNNVRTPKIEQLEFLFLSPEKGKPITVAGAWFLVRRNFEMIVPHRPHP